jgi:anti-sigma-K factor RskA
MTYQLWLIDESGPVPAGTFVPDSDGTAAVLLEGKAAPGQVVGITVEPSGGSPAPTGEVLFLADL